MKFVRTHRSLIAWMLCCVILFSGLVCSLGHGQMLGAFSAADPAMDMDMAHMDDMDMSKMEMPKMDMPSPSEHGLIMKMSMTDCAFAGTLTLALIFFISLSWLIRRVRPRLPAVYRFCRIPPRHTLPGLVPQAP
jgi:hypothetical protein